MKKYEQYPNYLHRFHSSVGVTLPTIILQTKPDGYSFLELQCSRRKYIIILYVLKTFLEKRRQLQRSCSLSSRKACSPCSLTAHGLDTDCQTLALQLWQPELVAWGLALLEKLYNVNKGGCSHGKQGTCMSSLPALYVIGLFTWRI